MSMNINKYCPKTDPKIKDPKWLYCPWCGIPLYPKQQEWITLP